MGLQSLPVPLVRAPAQKSAQQHGSSSHLQQVFAPAHNRFVGTAAQQANQQPHRVDQCTQPNRQCQTRMRNPGHQDCIHDLGQHQNSHGNLHRRAHVLTGKVAGRQDLDCHQSNQSCPIANQRQSDFGYIAALQRTPVEQGGHQWLGKCQQTHGTGHSQQHHQTQAPIEHIGVALRIARRFGRCQLRRQHNTQRHAQQCGGELHQTIGVKQPRHTARCQVGGDLRINHQADLCHPHPQQGRQHQRQDAAHAAIAPRGLDGRRRDANAGQQTQFFQHGQLHTQLEHATQHDPCGHGIDGFNALVIQPWRQQQGCTNHANVQQDRRYRRHRKLFPGIEHPSTQRHHGHEADVGEHPARHQHCCFLGMPAFKATGQQPHQYRSTCHAHHAGQQQHPKQHGGDIANQCARSLLALLGFGGRQHRNKGLTERPFGKQAPKQVRNTEGDVEGVRERIGSEHGGHDQITGQTCDPGGQGHQRNSGGGFEK